MIQFLEVLLLSFRPAFSRQSTFHWFVVVFIGFLIRTDFYGVSSIIRAISIAPVFYPNLLHFFHSSAFSSDSLRLTWWNLLTRLTVSLICHDQIVLIGDHTKNVKDGRKMPSVTTLHQDSETGSKPSFFRGHQWGVICLLIKTAQKVHSLPLWSEIHNAGLKVSQAVRIVQMGIEISQSFNRAAVLVLDAFFAVGPVFNTAANKITILTKAKNNAVAYKDPRKKKKSKRGRPALYGSQVKLFGLFSKRKIKFKSLETSIYNGKERIKYLTLDLIWKPVGKKIRFFLINSIYGMMILMTNDLQMDVKKAVALYCNRVSIETFFDTLKNLLGGLRYHFWSKYLQPQSRRPIKNSKREIISSNPEKTDNTLQAINKFVFIQIIVAGTLQILSMKFSKEICKRSDCWLRTPCGNIPSLFITRIVLINIFTKNIIDLVKSPIIRLIIAKQRKTRYNGSIRQAA